ncbi:MAG: OmpH family outer membrane protein [candidate division Zixibacteria bacterium]|nr:OmpH family outer membrane protein [candidate division Zixibacteria bacterium]
MLKKSLYLFGLLFLGMTLLTRAVPAQQPKIGYVDVEKLKFEYKEFADAQEKFSRQLAQWRTQDSTMQGEILALREELDKQGALLTEAKRQEKQQQILAKQKAYQEFATRVLGTDGEMARKERELSKPLIDKINEKIQLVALRDGYALILDSSGGNVLYAKEDMDLTAKILDELNKGTTK